MSGAVHTHMHTHAQHRNVPEALWSRNKQAAHRATLISAAAVPFKQGQSWMVASGGHDPPTKFKGK